MVFTGADDRSGELLSLCYRQQWEKARALLVHAALTAATISSALQQAVADTREETALFLLQTALPTSWDVNAAIHKDGRTLLHVAAERKNLPLISALLKAGAHWDVADKRGVRASDLAGWTDVVHPAVTVPLQDAIQQLRRRNVQLNDHIASLNARARSLLDGADAVRCAATELSLEVEVNRRYRNDIDAGIEVSQRELLVLQDAVAAEGPELERLQSDIAAVEAQRAVAAAQVESEREVIRDLHQQREGLDRQRGELECERARIKAEGAVKGEVVALTRSQLAGGGSSKRSFVVLSLRAMVALASRPASRRQLQCRDARGLALDTLTRFPDDQEIHVAACRLIVALGGMSGAHAGDDVMGASDALARLLTDASERFAGSPEVVAEIRAAARALS